MSSRENIRKILIDCDPGLDDAIAIVLAALHPSIEIVGITTVAGNVNADKTTHNALQICELSNIKAVPVVKGATRPLVRQPIYADYMHGMSGIGGVVLPKPNKKCSNEHAVDFIIRTLLESDEDITLVPIGPLTNIALALLKEPRIQSKIKEVVIMGGGTFGNITPVAEFNFFADAEAAKIVFNNNLPITMIGLDTTHQAVATDNIKNRIVRNQNPMSDFVLELIRYYEENYKKRGLGGPVLHDPCCIVYCIDPSVFTTKELYVDIECKGDYTYGMSIIDYHNVHGKIPNAKVTTTIQQDKFWNIIFETLAGLTITQ